MNFDPISVEMSQHDAAVAAVVMQAAGELFEYKGCSCDECMSGESC